VIRLIEDGADSCGEREQAQSAAVEVMAVLEIVRWHRELPKKAAKTRGWEGRGEVKQICRKEEGNSKGQTEGVCNKRPRDFRDAMSHVKQVIGGLSPLTRRMVKRRRARSTGIAPGLIADFPSLGPGREEDYLPGMGL
jgi:hypothetical protein